MEAVLESQEQLQALFLQRMDAFQAVLQQSASSDGTATLAEEFSSFRTYILQSMKSLQDQISLLARESDNQEMRARRKILLIHGVPEEKDEDTTASVVKVVSDKLKVAEFTASDVGRCHRMGRSSGADRPRPILVKVRDMSLRQQLWFAKTALKGSGITMSEFLTKPRHDTFMAARQRFGVTKCWTRDGYVYVLGPDNKRHRISSLGELTQIQAPAPLKKKPEVTLQKKTLPPRVTRKVLSKQ